MEVFLHMFRFKIPFVISILFLISTCQLADIRPLSLTNSEGNPQIKIRAAQIWVNPPNLKFVRGDWGKTPVVQFVLTDVWNSSFVRFFTPVPIPEQRLKVTIDRSKSQFIAEFLNGPKSGLILGLDKREPFQIAPDTGKVYTGDDEVRVYLESLQFYLQIVWELNKYPIFQYAGESQKLGMEYQMLYATKGKPEAHPENDQILAYLESRTGALEYVEFTYREVFKSYKGLLKLGTYEDWNGKLFPRKISILDNWDSTQFVHEIRIDRIEIPMVSKELDPQIQEQN